MEFIQDHNLTLFLTYPKAKFEDCNGYNQMREKTEEINNQNRLERLAKVEKVLKKGVKFNPVKFVDNKRKLEDKDEKKIQVIMKRRLIKSGDTKVPLYKVSKLSQFMVTFFLLQI